ncbi:hypothetical protein CHLRE_07g353250v5 [Chlamydomonas reinhardtii]|uniref:Uncharacterized protein n=1 Tax=Chlamydomonas reinhardtii TaxID=3055 RepID=A0A2K3DLF8_CHLRE|nr:uncharacterized protein CHLRE_07g353250v5 [Chlamydomonas reinhardtii]PNW81372.1 hypothetical protein CHLRE_07g353250v5 [Chlamydomonas reinhardtii]
MIDADCYSDVDLPSHPSPPASEAGSSLLLWRANTSEGDAKAHARVLRERSKQAQRSRKRLAAILKSQLVYSRSLNGTGGASPVYVLVRELDMDSFEDLLGPQLLAKAVVSPKQASLDVSAPEDQAALFGRPPYREMRGAGGFGFVGCRLQLASLELVYSRESRTLVVSGMCALVRAL